MSDKNAAPTNVVVGTKQYPVRFSYANVFSARAMPREDGTPGEPKFSTMVIYPKDAPYHGKVKAAIDAAAKAKWSGKLPAKFKHPIRDGDEEADEKGEHLRGHFFFNASTKRRPNVVGADIDEEGSLTRLEPGEFKSGDYGKVSVNFYPFDVKGNRGVAAGLNNVQKLVDGEPLGSERAAEDDFADDDDDLLN